jgi:hypothetical protein
VEWTIALGGCRATHSKSAGAIYFLAADPKLLRISAAEPWTRDMASEVDFSKGSRGNFFQQGAGLSLPAYLDSDVPDYLTSRPAPRHAASRSLNSSMNYSQEGHRTHRGCSLGVSILRKGSMPCFNDQGPRLRPLSSCSSNQISRAIDPQL